MCLKIVMWFLLVSSCYCSSVKTDKCGGVLAWGEEITVPRDVDGRLYQNDMHCIFETDFKVDIDPNVLLLKWYAFEISGEMAESCITDYLEIFISCSYKSLGRFCGKYPPSDVISPDRCLRLVFHSDKAGSAGRGFKARLIVTRNLTPLHNYRNLVKFNSTSGSGIISSPGYPGYYPTHCPRQTFVFETTLKRTAMRLYFMEFNTRGTDGICQTPTDDILMIKVSKVSENRIVHETHTLCGVREPFVFTWRDYHQINIKFRTNNDSLVSRGFVAGYMIYQTEKSSRSNKATNPWERNIFTFLLFVSGCFFSASGVNQAAWIQIP